jgi:hypothetical protein
VSAAWVVHEGNALDVLRGMADASVDAVVTDPPYGVRKDSWEPADPAELMRFTMAWLSECRRISDRLVVFFSGRHVHDLQTLCRMVYPEVRLMFWDKPWGSQYAGSSEGGAWFAYEAILYCHPGFDAGKARRVAEMIRAARKSAGLSCGAVDMAVRGKKTGLCYRWEEASCLPTDEQIAILEPLLSLDGEFREAVRESRTAAAPAQWRDVFSHRTVTGAEHPCEKPAGLMRDIVEFVGAGTILDPFCGSGSTGIACLETGRSFIGVEQDADYAALARRRLAAAAGQSGLFANVKIRGKLKPAPYPLDEETAA